MPVLCDVSYLAPLCYAYHKHHALALSWLDEHDIPKLLAVCRMSQLGLLRLLCTRAVMHEDVLSAVDAWRTYDGLMQDDRFIFVPEPSGIDAVLRRYTPRRGLATSLWTDAYLAAFAYAAGFAFVTFDRAFQQFTGLDLVVLGEEHDTSVGQ